MKHHLHVRLGQMAIWLKKGIPFLCFFLSIFAEAVFLDTCIESRCSIDGPAIRFPFRLKGRQPEWCAYNSGFDLYCTERKQTVLELPSSVKVLVNSIDYESQVLSVSDPEGCLPKQIANFSLSASPFLFQDQFESEEIALFNCSGTFHRNADSKYFSIWGNFSCLDVAGYEVIAVPSTYMIIRGPLLSCTRIQSHVSVPNSFYENSTVSLLWHQPDCKNCKANGGQCKLKENKYKRDFECIPNPHKDCKNCKANGGQCKLKENKYKRDFECIPNPHKGSSKWKEHAGEILAPFVLILAGVVVYCFYVARFERQSYKRIKKFLEDYKAFKPARYSYADIKRITNQFKDELGQGAYGTVYKGKLSNEIQVAVKVLNTSTGNGQEFINGMETMCQIHHVNVARLVGFCADGLRRALVYEFLPNGSLQKFITSADTKDLFLGWGKLHDIALGIAKGIEYLHEDCDKRILHFDIKPHNILLDDKFTPKISDFGLAKLCSKDQSIVSMTTARGTLGYIAPEIFTRNFGNVSSKSDVYSYGMLLLEMVGGRKITEVTAENSSQVYYPQWIYSLLENNEDIQIHIEGEEDTKIAKKLSIVGLWCIQWHPANRPTMKAVVQMLEGDGEKLVMPPNPFASTPSTKTRHLNPELSVISEIE